MATNVRVTKNKKESEASLLRRFRREVNGTNVLRALRSKRFFSRKTSKNTRKNAALVRIERTKEFEKNRKLGLL